MFEPVERHPEDIVHAWSRARTLHTIVTKGGALASRADFRTQMSRSPELSKLKPALRRILSTLEQRLEGSSSRALLRLGSSPIFAEDRGCAGLLQQLVLDSRQPDEVVAELSELFGREGFRGLEREARYFAIRAACAGVGARPTGQALTFLLSEPAFLGSEASLKAILMELLAGPTVGATSAPERTEVLMSAWGDKMDALQTLRASEAWRGASSPALRSEQLRDFVEAPTEHVTFLDATPHNGHALVILGNPSDPRALSYGRRWVRVRGQSGVVARLSMPDRTLMSNWSRPMSDAQVRYFGRSLRVSRRQQLQLVNWIEKTYVFAEVSKGRGLGASRIGGEAADLVSSAYDALRAFGNHCPDDLSVGAYVAGRPVDL